MKIRVLDNVRQFIETTIAIVQPQLDMESIDSINHYLIHDEYEMAFEGLFIEVMKSGGDSKIDLQKSIEVGRILKLDKHSVFEHDFWKRFEAFVNNYKG